MGRQALGPLETCEMGCVASKVSQEGICNFPKHNAAFDMVTEPAEPATSEASPFQELSDLEMLSPQPVTYICFGSHLLPSQEQALCMSGEGAL